MFDEYLNQKIVVDLSSPFVCLGKLTRYDDHFLELKNADLHEARDEPLLHDPCERRRVRERVAVERVVEVRMRVEVKNAEVRVLSGEGADDWKSD